LQIFELRDSSRAFTLHIKFVTDSIFKIDNEVGDFTVGQLFKNSHGVFRLNKNSYSSPGKEYTVSWRPTSWITSTYTDDIQVVPTAGTDILSLSIETTNPQKSVDIINQLMIEYGEMTKEDKSEEAALTLAFVDTSLKSVQHEIDSIQKEKADFQKANNLIDLENQTQNYFTNLSDADRGEKDQEIL
jgi:tyrosine-protein kinase Etk/Wzc